MNFTKQINDDQNYIIVEEKEFTPGRTLRKGEIIRGSDLKAMLVYNLTSKDNDLFYEETNIPLK